VIRSLRLSISKTALRDLASIYGHVSQDNPAAAFKLVKFLEGKIKSLARSGNKGVARDWLRPGLRAFPYKQRCIYFTVDGDVLKVIRILHGKQDIDPELFASDDEE